jgi:hypothetical protein
VSIPDLIGMGGCRGNLKTVCHAVFFYKFFEIELRHTGTADIAVADE